MKIKFTISILFLLLFTSCTREISVLVKIIGIDRDTDKLELEFSFKDKELNKDVEVSNIQIFKDDTLHYELEVNTNSTTISKWHFPYVPKGFRIIFPENEVSIRHYSKTDKMRFDFTSYEKKGGIAEWRYRPSFLLKINRSLFDENGNKTINIEAFYETWIGKDIIKIYSNTNLNIEDQSIRLTNSNYEELEFKLRKKKTNDKIIILTMEKDLKRGQVINLNFKTIQGNIFSDQIIATGKSSIGLIGKYK